MTPLQGIAETLLGNRPKKPITLASKNKAITPSPYEWLKRMPEKFFSADAEKILGLSRRQVTSKLSHAAKNGYLVKDGPLILIDSHYWQRYKKTGKAIPASTDWNAWVQDMPMDEDFELHDLESKLGLSSFAAGRRLKLAISCGLIRKVGSRQAAPCSFAFTYRRIRA